MIVLLTSGWPQGAGCAASERGRIVARYGKEHKEATRRRIVEVAGRRFKQDGIDGAGVSALMADAGLTNGAFYAHFESKEDLVATAISAQLSEQRRGIEELPDGRASVDGVIRDYLSASHRDDRAQGCPSAALLDEIGRLPDKAKEAYTDGLMAIIDELARRLRPEHPQAARVTALSVFALMIGTMQLARALTDPELVDQLLEQGIENALALLDGAHST
jgi:TetR/AcrR family transcriptional repressor of nem operon